MYASTPEMDDADAPRFETDGLGPPTAVDVSQVATGQQQRAYVSCPSCTSSQAMRSKGPNSFRPKNIGAESSTDCVAHWLASAFTGGGKKAWYYQYSVPFAVHAADLAAYYGPPMENQGPDFVTAFQSALSARVPIERCTHGYATLTICRDIRQLHNVE